MTALIDPELLYLPESEQVRKGDQMERDSYLFADECDGRIVDCILGQDIKYPRIFLCRTS